MSESLPVAFSVPIDIPTAMRAAAAQALLVRRLAHLFRRTAM